MNNYTHQPVLLQETLKALAIKENGIYVDGTFGRGGHTKEILKCLNQDGKLIAIDKDEQAVNHARQEFAEDKRFTIVQSSFAKIDDIAKQLNIFGKINGIFFDLGVSSPQLDDPSRGFSFLHDGPLDMRMNKTQKLSAKEFINSASIKEMALVFKKYGEERFATRIAKAISLARETAEILTTNALSEIVKTANPKWEKHKHPATRVFQAIRIYVNQELEDLIMGLKNSLNALAVGGRLVVISFHSLEDRIVKQFMRDEEKGIQLPKNIPIMDSALNKTFKCISRAIKPTDFEINANPRARSAVLRVGEKIA